MKPEVLRTFISLANYRSFTRVAQDQLVAQSTVSTRIRELEEELGQKLFSRGRNGMLLTAAGRTLLIYAKAIVDMESAAISEVGMVGKYSGLIRVTAVHNVFDCYISRYAVHFMKKHLDIAVKIDIAHSKEIVVNLGTGIPDVAFTYCTFQHPNYVCVPFIRDRIVLVTGKGNTKYKEGITHEDMLDLPLLRSDLFNLSDVEWIMPSHRVYSLDINIISRAIPFLKESDWYCVMPIHVVQDELASGELIEIPLVDIQLPEKQSYMIYRFDYMKIDPVNRWIEGINSFSWDNQS